MDFQPGPLLILATGAVLAPLAAELAPVRIPVVVVEIALGIALGPHALGLIQPDGLLAPLSTLGLAFLFFLGGLEIDLARVRGRPLKLAVTGWMLSFALALIAAWLIHRAGIVRSELLLTVALATTAVGTLLPILRDAGQLRTRFGDFALAAGAIGELAPIVVISLFLMRQHQRLLQTAVLLSFTLVTVGAAVVALRYHPPRLVAVLTRTMHRSAQLPVRISLLLLLCLVVLAEKLHLDVILGAFSAGMVVALAAPGDDSEPLRHKLDGIGYGFLIPMFFIASGVKLDLLALVGDSTGLFKVPLFLGLFVAARGLPALLYRSDLALRELPPLALLSSTALPLVVAITEIGHRTGRMAPVTAAALVGAGVISVLVFPSLALLLIHRGGRAPDVMARPAPASDA